MTNGWTGGQYSLYRAILGGYLCVHFAQLIPWGPELFSNVGAIPDGSASPLLSLFPNLLALADGPLFVSGLLTVGALLAVLLAIGWHDRLAAVLLWYLWACLVGRNPLILNPGIPYIGWLMLAHAFLPPAPYGSLAARGRPDPRGDWRMPTGIFAVAWVLMALGYSYSGYTKLVSPSWIDGTALASVLDNPLARPTFLRELLLGLPDLLLRTATWAALALELAFAPLALFRRTRPWIWIAMVAMHLSLILVIDFADLTVGMLMLHLFTFDPAWIRPLAGSAPETVFYDGSCGLCHRTVRFLLAEDGTGETFRYAPIDSQNFRTRVPRAARDSLPDSVIVMKQDGTLLTRSSGVLYAARRLGGLWRLLATAALIVPQAVRDWTYDRIARVRTRLFARPTEACPIVPAELRRRFDTD